MKNLLLTTVLILAVIFSSNATNDVNGPAKKVSPEQGQPSLFPSITLPSKPIKIKQVIPLPTGASVVVAVFVV